MTKNNIILIDMDGVLTDHTPRHCAAFNEHFGTSLTPADITSFEYDFLTPEQRHFMMCLWDLPGIYDEDSLTAEQLEVLDGLREIGRVVACSSPMAGHIESKYRFLTRYFDRADIVLASDKDLVDGDILIDDSPRNIRAFSGHTIIYDRPWNQGVKGPRARSFEDLGPLVQDYYITQEMLDDDDFLFAI
jgi:5'-nucleotidase